jgi:hypothetical protein
LTRRDDLSSVADVAIGGLFSPTGRADVRLHDGVLDIEESAPTTRSEEGARVVTSGG